jgi:hypothetical protein
VVELLNETTGMSSGRFVVICMSTIFALSRRLIFLSAWEFGCLSAASKRCETPTSKITIGGPSSMESAPSGMKDFPEVSQQSVPLLSIKY